MSGQGSTAAGSPGRSASALPTILPRNGLVLEGIQNSPGQTVATGFRNLQGGINDNVLAITDALGNDAIAFQGDEHTARTALGRIIALASVTPDTRIAGFFFVATPTMIAMSPDELQVLNLIRLRLPTDPATSSRPSVEPNHQNLTNGFHMAENNVDSVLPRRPRRPRRARRVPLR